MTLATTNETPAPETATAIVAAPGSGPYNALAERLGWGDNLAAFHAVMLDQVFRPSKNGKRPSKPAMAAFAHVCNEYELNPLRREIFALYDDRKDICIPYVSVDGWIKRMTQHPDWDGYEAEFSDDSGGAPVSCTVRLYRKNLSRPVVHTEYLCENRKAKSADSQYGPWWDRPRRMLLWKTLMQAIRVAFGVSGLYDEDEAHEALRNGDAPLTPVGGVSARARAAVARLEGASAPPADALQTPDAIIEAELAASAPEIGQDAPQADGRPEAAPSAPDAPGAVPDPATGREKDTQELPGGWTRFRIAKIAGERKSTKGGVCLSVLTTDGEKFDFWSTRLHQVARAASESGVFVYGRIADKGVVEELSTEPPASGDDLLTA